MPQPEKQIDMTIQHRSLQNAQNDTIINYSKKTYVIKQGEGQKS